jgi:SAM-dependent methyltransferase
MTTPSSWQLPEGIDQGLWHYVTDPSVAAGYDTALAGAPLLETDLRFCEKWLAPSGRLIDLGCGTGRLMVPFAARGYRVLGVDLSDEMLKVAADKAGRAGVPVDYLRANLVDLGCVADGAFDHAACLFSTLGMLRGADARARAVGHVFRLLRPGGRFVLHVHNRWFNLHDRAGRRWLAANLWRSLAGAEPAGDRFMPGYLGVAGLTLHQFTRRETLRLLRGAGFRVQAVEPVGVGAAFRRPYLLPSLRAYGYLVAAEKPHATRTTH